MKKIISVVGSTASGKTSLALKIASYILQPNPYLKQNLNTECTNVLDRLIPNENFSGIDLISVDSRQVYKGLEVLSGADVPDNFKLVESESEFGIESSIFKHTKLDICLHGVSIINFNQDWSVAHFKDFATKIIVNSFKNNRLPILVGGTGLYHEHLFKLDNNLYVPPNYELREKAKNLSLVDLQNWLEEVNSEKLKKMNNSDINNPRRLIRAIEISVGVPDLKEDVNFEELKHNEFEIEKFGIDLNLEKIEQKIKLRVDQRFNDGAVEEVKGLLKECAVKDLPVCSTLGVNDISEFLDSKTTQIQCKENWALHEFQYAKRQLTWFKKQIDIIWLDG
jgi:tRNA dimethylallyltransferase